MTNGCQLWGVGDKSTDESPAKMNGTHMYTNKSRPLSRLAKLRVILVGEHSDPSQRTARRRSLAQRKTSRPSPTHAAQTVTCRCWRANRRLLPRRSKRREGGDGPPEQWGCQSILSDTTRPRGRLNLLRQMNRRRRRRTQWQDGPPTWAGPAGQPAWYDRSKTPSCSMNSPPSRTLPGMLLEVLFDDSANSH